MAATTGDRTERKRVVTRWNRRLGWALVVVFPASYVVDWWDGNVGDNALGAWLSLFNVGIQVLATLVLLAHAAYSFYVFGFPSPRWNLRSLNGYASYLVLLVYLLSQAAVNIEPQAQILLITAFILIGLHVVMATILARRRPPRDEPDLREDWRAAVNPDAQILDGIAASQAPSTTRGPVLSAKAVDVTLGSVKVLYGVDLEVREGEVVALLGNNGAGKTTTLRALSGLQKVTAGRIDLDGHDVTGLSAAGRAHLGLTLVTGGQAVFGELSVRENLEMFAYGVDLSTAQRDERVDEVMSTFPWIADRANQPASTLSGGEQQMLALSQALLVRPQILLVDEFSLGLAPKIVGRLMELVDAIAGSGTAVLLVEQSANVALELAQRVYVMERGRIVLVDTADALRQSPERLSDVLLQGANAEVAR
jgi:branched-chain amino acid transport system ATP-binding protein